MVKVAAFLAFAATSVNGQFLSVMKSTSWVQGSDGKMHEETHAVRSEITQGHDLMKKTTSDVRCVDGDCQERDTVSFKTFGAEPEMPPPPPMAALFGGFRPRQQRAVQAGIPPCPHLRGLLRGMGLAPPATQEAKPELVVVMSDVPPARERLWEAAPQPQVHQPPKDWEQTQEPVDFGLLALLATSSLLGVLAVARVFCSPSASARELRDLAEPLASSQHDEAAPAPPALKEATNAPQTAAQPEEVTTPEEPAFEFKPSVGTWLVHVSAKA